ncbi:MAG: SDR family NAD(P)-dependent oxidoreductase [Isosphaeraceae bacterium]
MISATAFGGAFGFGGDEPLPHPELGGRIGFIKTLAQEWREVRVKAVDLPRTSTEDAAARLFGELFAGDELTEVGYHEGERTVLDLSPAPLRTAHQALPVDRDSVVLVTGGARGITALAALAIAEIARPTIILVGRTSLLVAAEAAEMSHVVDQRDLRKAVLERFAREGKRVSPAYVEAACLRILRAREVAESIRKLENTGARVHYHSCDVSDAASFRCLIEEIYRTFGRIDGVIHGAGLIEDRLIKDKQLDSFRRVVDTKATSALVLARTLRPELLRFLVFFGSVSGRYGNRGQADYAAANEILNKLARDLDRRWPGRVISLNWGPWLGSGMVSPEVERQFADRGVVLIPPDVGCRMLVEELISGRKGDAEIVIGGANGTAPDLPQRSRAASEWDGPKVAERTLRGDVSGARLPLMRGASVASRGDDFLEVVRWLDPEVDLYLRDHVLDGHPVLPFAVAMELMAEVASIGWPGFRLREVHDIRLLRGIVVDESRKEIRVSARARPRQPRTAGQDASETLDVVITPAEGPRRVQYRAVVELERLSAEHSGLVLPGFSSSPAPLRGAGPMPMSIEEAYQKWLFHGPIFRGIQSIESICPDGARAILRMSSPNDCLRDGEPRGWLLDPVLIDSAFQMQVLWARLHWDVTLLPAGVQSCRFLDRRREDPGAGEPAIRSDRGRVRAIREELTYELRIRPESEVPLCTADHYFFDSTGRQVGTLLRVEGTGSRKLNRLSSPQRRWGRSDESDIGRIFSHTQRSLTCERKAVHEPACRRAYDFR